MLKIKTYNTLKMLYKNDSYTVSGMFNTFKNNVLIIEIFSKMFLDILFVYHYCRIDRLIRTRCEIKGFIYDNSHLSVHYSLYVNYWTLNVDLKYFISSFLLNADLLQAKPGCFQFKGNTAECQEWAIWFNFWLQFCVTLNCDSQTDLP